MPANFSPKINFIIVYYSGFQPDCKMPERTCFVGLMNIFPVWDSLLSMLRLMDIISLINATKHRLHFTQDQIQHYIKWQRQIFYDIKWVNRFVNITARQIVIISKDLNRLNRAIESWDYFNTKEMKLLVVIKENLPDSERDEAMAALLTSIDSPYMYGINKDQVQLQVTLVQTCIIYRQSNSYICDVDLCISWAKSLLELTSILVCRKTLRAGTTLQFGGLKSLPYKYVKLYSVYYCSLAISLQRLGLQ